MMDISSSSHLKSECIDPQNGLYAVHKSIHGASTPLHVQIKIWGEQHHVSCELGECQANMELAWRSGLQSYQCVHLRSVSYCKTFLTSPSLREDSLKEMVKSKWFGKDKIKLCVDRQTLAKENNAPLSVLSKIGAPPSKKFISVHEPTISYYSRLGRVMVSYDTKKIHGTVLVQKHRDHARINTSQNGTYSKPMQNSFGGSGALKGAVRSFR